MKLAKEVEAPEHIIAGCAKINPVYIVVRYPESDELPSETVDEKKAREIRALAQEVLAWVKKNLL